MAELVCPVPSNENAERIVREAWSLFQESGYRGASVAELCRRCGITKPTLYYYFHDKETLFVHVILRQLRGYREILGSDGPLPGRLTALATAMLTSFATDISAMMRDMAHVKDQGHRETVQQAFREEVFDPLASVLGAELDGADRPAAEFLAWAYLGLVNTFVGKSERLAIPPEEIARRLVALFLNGVPRRNAV